MLLLRFGRRFSLVLTGLKLSIHDIAELAKDEAGHRHSNPTSSAVSSICFMRRFSSPCQHILQAAKTTFNSTQLSISCADDLSIGITSTGQCAPDALSKVYVNIDIDVGR